MKRRWHWNERTRLLLTLQLAVALPAAALILFNVHHLKSIQRNSSVEALIQRDFNQVLLISEKRLSERADDMVEQVRSHLPDVEDACANPAMLDHVLNKYPYTAHVFIWEPDHGFRFRSRASRMEDPDFHKESESLAKELAIWMKLDYEELTKKFLKMKTAGKLPAYYFANMAPRGEKHEYQSGAFFLTENNKQHRPAIGGVVFDSEFLRYKFLPDMLGTILTHDLTDTPDANGYGHVTMMAHMRGESAPVASCGGWDGGIPEVERNVEAGFPGLTLAIKLRGTTLKALGHRWVRESFLMLAGLSVLLIAGIFLTYRNVTKEVALAKLKSDFVSNVSHELRTPLSLIRLYAETLEMGRLSNVDKREEYYRIIRKESERLTALINNILDFSRIEAGRKEYDFRQTDIAELVQNTLESYRYQIEQHGFEFQQNIADDLPPVRVDREAIARSLVNLVNNALKYSGGDKFVGVNVYRENGALKLEVIDHGIGIARTEQHKIFEKFYRVCDPLVHNTKGSGLGLSLVQHIVQAHGGAISVDSTPGQGSKFTIVLPLEHQVGEVKAAQA